MFLQKPKLHYRKYKMVYSIGKKGQKEKRRLTHWPFLLEEIAFLEFKTHFLPRSRLVCMGNESTAKWRPMGKSQTYGKNEPVSSS